MADETKNKSGEYSQQDIFDEVGDTSKKPERKTAPKEKTFSQAEVEKMVAEAVAKAIASIPQQQTIVQMKPEEYVTLLYIGVSLSGTVVSLGKLGQINRSGGTLRIGKEKFFQELDHKTERLLRKRKVLVIDGLTDDERKRYGVDYKPHELLTEDMFLKLLDYPQDRIIDIFSQLCPEHKIVVAQIFAEAYDKGSNKIHLDTVKKLNKISKSVDADGMFTLIIKDMSKKLGEDDD